MPAGTGTGTAADTEALACQAITGMLAEHARGAVHSPPGTAGDALARARDSEIGIAATIKFMVR